jgi:hypothetical protein
VEEWEADDVTTIIGGLFDINAKLDDVGGRVLAIRELLEGDDEEEEEEI